MVPGPRFSSHDVRHARHVRKPLRMHLAAATTAAIRPQLEIQGLPAGNNWCQMKGRARSLRARRGRRNAEWQTQ